MDDEDDARGLRLPRLCVNQRLVRVKGMAMRLEGRGDVTTAGGRCEEVTPWDFLLWPLSAAAVFHCFY
jgi:hypothetical protein